MAVVAVLALAAAAPAAAGADRETASLTWTATRPGTPTGGTLDVYFRDPSDPSGKPHTLKTFAITYPPGTAFDPDAVPRCSATDAELMLEGAAACPPDSRVGTGTIVTDTGSTSPSIPRYVTNDVTQFNAGDEVIVLAEAQTDPPVRAVSRAKRTGTTFTSEIPPFPGNPPPEPFTAFRTMHIENPVLVRDGRAFTSTPPTCPKSRAWTIDFSFTYWDGVTETTQAQTPCQPVRSRS
jgi:hypothetical protein